jgi:8-oxo-dGTP pyrophosphatase MutT (NUDIX family)
MRHSELALVIIRLNIGSEPYLVLMRHEKWNDWSLVGGHVEPHERNDWARAAKRECNEELAPLQYGKDFTLLPLLDRPFHWGPVPSRSAGNEPTTYTAQLFALRFLSPPAECLARLPASEFQLVREADVLDSRRASEDTDLTARALRKIEHGAVAWDYALPAKPSLQASKN